MEELKRVFFMTHVLQLHGEEDDDEASQLMLKRIDANYKREDAMMRKMAGLERKSDQGGSE